MALGHVLIDLTELADRLDAQFAVLERIAALQAQILTNTKKILKQEELSMTKADDLRSSVDALTTAFDDATNEIAKDLQDLRDKISTGLANGLTAEEAATLQASIDSQLGAARDRLIELGKDPADPIPE